MVLEHPPKEAKIATGCRHIYVNLVSSKSKQRANFVFDVWLHDGPTTKSKMAASIFVKQPSGLNENVDEHRNLSCEHQESNLSVWKDVSERLHRSGCTKSEPSWIIVMTRAFGLFCPSGADSSPVSFAASPLEASPVAVRRNERKPVVMSVKPAGSACPTGSGFLPEA